MRDYRVWLKDWEKAIKTMCEGETPLEKPQPPHCISIQNEVTKTSWDAETQEFRDEVERKMKEEHRIAMEVAYESSIQDLSAKMPTAEEYHK